MDKAEELAHLKERIKTKNAELTSLWVRNDALVVERDVLLAKKELGMGPDVFSVWRGDEKLGLALVKTLAISRALRAVNSLTIPIQATWNKQFDKWEVTGVVTN